MMSKTALDSCSMLHGGEGKYKKQEILLHFLFLKKVNIHLFQQWDVKKIFKASSTYPALSKVDCQSHQTQNLSYSWKTFF